MRADRELLEMAAKAAGMALYPGDAWRDTAMGVGLLLSNGRWIWNPLHHDGDALRLAVKLDFWITQWRNHSEYPPHVMVGYKTGPKSGSNWIQEYEDDEMAANRRAIVCAAAEIGKAMP